MDASKTGIQFAGETAKLSDYKTAVFMESGDEPPVCLQDGR